MPSSAASRPSPCSRNSETSTPKPSRGTPSATPTTNSAAMTNPLSAISKLLNCIGTSVPPTPKRAHSTISEMPTTKPDTLVTPMTHGKSHLLSSAILSIPKPERSGPSLPSLHPQLIVIQHLTCSAPEERGVARRQHHRCLRITHLQRSPPAESGRSILFIWLLVPWPDLPQVRLADPARIPGDTRIATLREDPGRRHAPDAARPTAPPGGNDAALTLDRPGGDRRVTSRSEEHTSELQSLR